MPEFITLGDVTRENWRESLTLSVRHDQQRFVSDYAPVALIGLAKAYVGALGLTWKPCAICADEQMIGFAALAFQPDTEDEYWLFHYFIDQRFQGRGYGQRALAALLVKVREIYPICRTMNLTVHPDNLPAQHLYTKAGFAATGTEAFGEPLYRLRIK